LAYKKKLSALHVYNYIYLRTSHAGKTGNILAASVSVSARACVRLSIHIKTEKETTDHKSL